MKFFGSLVTGAFAVDFHPWWTTLGLVASGAAAFVFLLKTAFGALDSNETELRWMRSFVTMAVSVPALVVLILVQMAQFRRWVNDYQMTAMAYQQVLYPEVTGTPWAKESLYVSSVAGLACWLVILTVIVWGAYRLARRSRLPDDDESLSELLLIGTAAAAILLALAFLPGIFQPQA